MRIPVVGLAFGLFLVVMWGWNGVDAMQDGTKQPTGVPRIDLEVHETIETATFAMG